MNVSRRSLMVGAGAAAWGLALPLRCSFAETEIKEYRLTAKPAVVNLTGDGHPDTAVWTYDGTVPGPELRVRQGEPLRVVVENKLGEDTTVHWHGIRLPNAMDGVPNLTQKPIHPGESFTYDFTPPDAGTFWYHPHADTLQQLGRGHVGPYRQHRHDQWTSSRARIREGRGTGAASDCQRGARPDHSASVRGTSA